MTKKRFTYEYDEYNGRLFDNRYQTFYYIEDSGENIELLCNRLNELNDENEQLEQQLKRKVIVNRQYEELQKLKKENERLKQEKDKWKQQCIHFKEMLDDMDIAYLCDEWIYEELKGDDGMTAKRFSGKGRGFWWDCKYMESPIGVAYCKKKDDFCLKGKCNEIESKGTWKRLNND